MILSLYITFNNINFYKLLFNSEPSLMLGSSNLLVSNGLDLIYTKLASKRSKPAITASLVGVTALPGASQLRSSFIPGFIFYLICTFH